MKNSVKNECEKPLKNMPNEPPPFKGIILDGRVYRAVRAKEFFHLCDNCDVGKDGLCPEGSLGAWLCNAFSYAYVGIPVRFRFSQQLTEALGCLE
ncbi:MAG: hypothetical protein K2L45_03200 [Muribaculaceae bacterium]|nr:hypothetical protein [Muribaculaceae bacterium]